MIVLQLNKTTNARVTDIKRVATAISDLSLEKSWTVTITSADETRRAKQNSLLHRWNKSWSDHNNERTGWAHGQAKYDWLLPLKLASESVKTRKRAEFEASVLAHIPLREHKIGAAYDLVRSRDIPVKLFAEWLTQYKNIAAAEGCLLTSNEDMLNDALLREAA